MPLIEQTVTHLEREHETDRRLPLILVVGPTAVGKTELAIQLAVRLVGEIVSADSRLFYRGMDIGTAKPTQAERDLVPHHLIDIADPDQLISLSDFQRKARQAISEIHQRGLLPFLVGGTGQYVRSVIEAWRIPRAEPDPGLRAILEGWAAEIEPEGLHNRLAVLDPAAAEQIDPRNLRRTIRAMEVIFKTGQAFSTQRRQGTSPYRTLMVGLCRPRDALYRRIDVRIQEMLAQGLVDEVQSLLDRGYSPELPTMSAIGYGELVSFLQGRMSLADAELQMKRRTRTFVRRQTNWFKPDDPDIHWFSVEKDMLDKLEHTIRTWQAGLA